MATRRRLEGTVPTILSICRCSLSPQSHSVSSLSQAAGEGHSTAVTGRLRSTKNSVSPGPSCLAKWRMSQGCCDSCRISWTNERYRWSWSVSRIGDRALMSRNPWCRCQRLALLPRLSLLPARTSTVTQRRNSRGANKQVGERITLVTRDNTTSLETRTQHDGRTQ